MNEKPVRPEDNKGFLETDQVLSDYTQGVMSFDDIKPGYVKIVGANLPDNNHELVSRFLISAQHKDPDFWLEGLPSILQKRIVEGKKDIAYWFHLFWDQQKDHQELGARQNAHLYSVGHLMSKHMNKDDFVQNINQLTQTYPESFLFGLKTGGLTQHGAKNISALRSCGVIGQDDVGIFLGHFVSWNKETPMMVAGQECGVSGATMECALSLDVLTALYENCRQDMKNVLVLAAGHIACRGREEKERTVARQFFIKHQTQAHACKLIEQLDINNFTVLWGGVKMRARQPGAHEIMALFQLIAKTPSFKIFTAMQQWKMRHTTSTNHVHATLLREIGMENFLNDYEKKVLMSEMPHKEASASRKM